MNLRTYRVMNDLTQKEMAEKLDISENTYSLWEKNILSVDVKKVINVTKILGINLSDLAEIDNEYQ